MGMVKFGEKRSDFEFRILKWVQECVKVGDFILLASIDKIYRQQHYFLDIDYKIRAKSRN